MKEYFHMKLFWKTFRVVICGFLIFEGIQIYHDYSENTDNQVRSSVSDEDIVHLDELSKVIQSSNHFDAQEFQKKWSELYKNNVGYYAICDDNHHVLLETDYKNHESFYEFDYFVMEESGKNYILDSRSFDEETFIHICDYIKECYEKNPKSSIQIQASIDNPQFDEKNHSFIVNSDSLKYFKLGDIEYKNTQKETKDYDLSGVHSSIIDYYDLKDDMELVDYRDVEELCRQLIMNPSINMEDVGTNGDHLLSYTFRKDLLYTCLSHYVSDKSGNYFYVYSLQAFNLNKSFIMKYTLLNRTDKYILILGLTTVMSMIVSYKGKNKKENLK